MVYCLLMVISSSFTWDICLIPRGFTNLDPAETNQMDFIRPRGFGPTAKVPVKPSSFSDQFLTIFHQSLVLSKRRRVNSDFLEIEYSNFCTKGYRKWIPCLFDPCCPVPELLIIETITRSKVPQLGLSVQDNSHVWKLYERLGDSS